MTVETDATKHINISKRNRGAWRLKAQDKHRRFCWMGGSGRQAWELQSNSSVQRLAFSPGLGSKATAGTDHACNSSFFSVRISSYRKVTDDASFGGQTGVVQSPCLGSEPCEHLPQPCPSMWFSHPSDCWFLPAAQ